MNTPLIILTILAGISFFIHTFIGDRDLKIIEPADDPDDNYKMRKAWTVSRAGWHWISADLLFLTVGLYLINFTEYFKGQEVFLLNIMFFYFLTCAVFFLLSIIISKQFPKNYFRILQWFLLLIMAGLTYWGLCSM
jgi:hypothetical protein